MTASRRAFLQGAIASIPAAATPAWPLTGAATGTVSTPTILLLGDSLFHSDEWPELLNCPHAICAAVPGGRIHDFWRNSEGVAGSGMVARLYHLRPRVTIVQGGINDWEHGRSTYEVALDIANIAGAFVVNVPDNISFVTSMIFERDTRATWVKTKAFSDDVNAKLLGYMRANNQGDRYINANSVLTENGSLKPQYDRGDGRHINAAGRAAWAELIKAKLASAGV